MEKKTYCTFTATLDPENVHRIYHDTQYGFPLSDDNALFERFILEINQAGLSWETILKKQENFHSAYHGFDIKKVAAYQDTDFQRLMNDAGIIRNRLKIQAAIFNANRVINLKKDFGSFKNWLDHHHPLPLTEWVRLFKKTFRFTGGEIVNEFLMSTGYLLGAHDTDCPVYHKILRQNPPWAKAGLSQ